MTLEIFSKNFQAPLFIGLDVVHALDLPFDKTLHRRAVLLQIRTGNNIRGVRIKTEIADVCEHVHAELARLIDFRIGLHRRGNLIAEQRRHTGCRAAGLQHRDILRVHFPCFDCHEHRGIVGAPEAVDADSLAAYCCGSLISGRAMSCIGSLFSKVATITTGAPRTAPITAEEAAV